MRLLARPLVPGLARVLKGRHGRSPQGGGLLPVWSRRTRGGIRDMAAQIITVAQHKGGAGKTTLVAHVAVTWAEAGQRVAILDTDPQASLGTWHRQRQAALGRRAQPLAYGAATGWRVRS